MALASVAAGAAFSALAALPAAAFAGLDRSGEPVTLTAAELAPLEGADPALVVGFAHRKRGWVQVPVQIDQRKVVDFGDVPGGVGAGGGVNGTVYGTGPSGHRALQYVDPGTFVGVDPDPGFDANDELTFMAGDTGTRARAQRGLPDGVSRKRATRVRIADPLRSGGKPAYLYLFRSKGGLDPAAGRDYVSYDFRLDSGPYKPTYRRGTGPNPESSVISTDAYEIGFSDRWYYDELRIRTGVANPVDVLDGFKFGFGPGECTRSEATFNAAEGAFVANVDGPVRAIRAYVGANSGPRTERTHYFYGDRHEIVTDLRVHSVPGPLIYRDMSPAAIGMRFRTSSNPSAVTVDGAPDTVSSAPADWAMWSGRQGSLFSADRIDSSFEDELMANASSFYLDDSTPPFAQCWGDAQALGQFGFRSTSGMPNTDPALGETETLRATTTEILAGPNAGSGRAGALSEQIDAPLRTRASALDRP